jgi:hypothetical protein
MPKKIIITNTDQSWNSKKRYKINEVVLYNGINYQNLTGSNSEPGVGLDWLLLDIFYQKSRKQEYRETVTWSGGTAPSGTTNHSYNWTKIDNVVTLNVTLVYATAGSSNTGAIIPLPNTIPAPIIPNGLNAALSYIYPAYGKFTLVETSITTAASEVGMRINSTSNGYDFVITQQSANAKVLKITCQYFTE